MSREAVLVSQERQRNLDVAWVQQRLRAQAIMLSPQTVEQVLDAYEERIARMLRRLEPT
jgi:hypothetical protein